LRCNGPIDSLFFVVYQHILVIAPEGYLYLHNKVLLSTYFAAIFWSKVTNGRLILNRQKLNYFTLVTTTIQQYVNNKELVTHHIAIVCGVISLCKLNRDVLRLRFLAISPVVFPTSSLAFGTAIPDQVAACAPLHKCPIIKLHQLRFCRANGTGTISALLLCHPPLFLPLLQAVLCQPLAECLVKRGQFYNRGPIVISQIGISSIVQEPVKTTIIITHDWCKKWCCSESVFGIDVRSLSKKVLSKLKGPISAKLSCAMVERCVTTYISAINICSVFQ
jgi:hypothetical protein